MKRLLWEETFVSGATRCRVHHSALSPIFTFCLELDCGKEAYVRKGVKHNESQEDKPEHVAETLLEHLKKGI